MSKYNLILKHFDLKKRQKMSIKKTIRRTENEKTKNETAHDYHTRNQVKSSISQEL